MPTLPFAGRPALLALLPLLLAACGSDASSPGALAPGVRDEGALPPAGNPPMGGPDTLVVRPGLPLAALLDPAADARTLLARLDAPRRAEAEAVPNRHVPGQTDTVRTLVYDGLTLEVYQVAGGATFLQRVAVTGEGYETAEGLGVGSPRAAVEAVYAHPAGASGGAVRYDHYDGPDDPTPTGVEVRYAGDRVAAMTWSFYVD